MGLVEITYFSDILCIWAYASQARINAIKEEFVDRVRIEHRFCSIFGDTERKITSNWKDSGGYEGFNSHLRHVAKRFPHIEVHPEIWLKTRPATSASTHLFIKAIQQSFCTDHFRSSDMGVPLCVLPRLSGHRSLGYPMRDRRSPRRRYRRR
jgi:hypothetical protein